MGLDAQVLKIRHVPQTHTSANCGPCTLKMALDFHGITKRDGTPYSVHSLNRLLRVDSEYGCEKSDFRYAFRQLGIKVKKIRFDEIETYIDRHRPIISLFLDEDLQGHYSIVCGYDPKHYHFMDPWHKRRVVRDRPVFREMSKVYGDWLIVLEPPASN